MMDTRKAVIGDIYAHKFFNVETDTDDLIPKKIFADKNE